MFTKIECGECGGTYGPFGDLFLCGQCDHIIAASDLLPYMDEGESLTVRDGALGYVALKGF